MSLLADLYSTIDSKKRQLRGLLSDPLETLYQGVRNFGAEHQGLLDLQARAYPWTGNDRTAAPDLMARKALADAGAAQGMSAATVWHGSPHKFDKFDSSKIGTGEGAQAYGHGLYLAENPRVAKDYADKLPDVSSPYSYVWNGQTYEKGAQKNPTAHALGLIYHQNQSTAKQIAKQGLADAKAGQPYALEMGGVDYYQQMLDVANKANKKAVTAQQGSLYKVDIPDEHIAKMLDWDKPLSKQSKEVQRAIAKTKTMLPPNAIDDLGGDLSLMYGPDVTPKDFLNTWESFGQKAGGENALQKLGIPGIRYLDGGSRGAGQGTSNFVVFPGNEGLLSILERNGKSIK